MLQQSKVDITDQISGVVSSSWLLFILMRADIRQIALRTPGDGDTAQWPPHTWTLSPANTLAAVFYPLSTNHFNIYLIES